MSFLGRGTFRFQGSSFRVQVSSFRVQVSSFAAVRRRHPSRFGIDKHGLLLPPSLPPLSGDRNAHLGRMFKFSLSFSFFVFLIYHLGRRPLPSYFFPLTSFVRLSEIQKATSRNFCEVAFKFRGCSPQTSRFTDCQSRGRSGGRRSLRVLKRLPFQ